MPMMLDRFKSLTREVQDRAIHPLMSKGVEPTTPVELGALSTGTKSLLCRDSSMPCLTVCTPVKSCDCDCQAVKDALAEELAKYGIEMEIGKAKTGCGGKCRSGPFLGFPQKQVFYVNVKPENVPEIVLETVVKGKVIFPLLSVSPNRSYRSDLLFERETGMLAAIDDSVCMVEVAKYFLDWEEGLSCGKCVPCRLGMKRMQEGMERIVSGSGTLEDLEQIKILCHTMINASHCEFAMASSRPILSAVTHFEDEFLAHIEKQECAAGVCAELVELQKKKAARARMKSRKKKKKK